MSQNIDLPHRPVRPGKQKWFDINLIQPVRIVVMEIVDSETLVEIFQATWMPDKVLAKAVNLSIPFQIPPQAAEHGPIQKCCSRNREGSFEGKPQILKVQKAVKNLDFIHREPQWRDVDYTVTEIEGGALNFMPEHEGEVDYDADDDNQTVSSNATVTPARVARRK